MQSALGVVGLRPADFWAMSFREWNALLEGRDAVNRAQSGKARKMSAKECADLRASAMKLREQYPDGVPSRRKA